MSGPEASPRQSRAAMAFSVGLSVATAALVWLGYVATREWRRGTTMLHQRLAAEMLALTDAALSRDMRGAWTSLIVPVNLTTVQEEPPYDLLHKAAQTFAKFPYPESLIVWNGSRSRTYVFNRADRPPDWYDPERTDDPFPVVVLADPPALEPVVKRLQAQARPDSPFSLFEVDVAGTPYQVVAHVMFSPTPPQRLGGFAAFTINLKWVRLEYFAPILSQITRIGSSGISLAVSDDRGDLVASSGTNPSPLGQMRRTFPLVFLEPALAATSKTRDMRIREWAVHVNSSVDDAVGAAVDGANRVLILIAVAALASAIALFQTVRAVRASARLASMRSEFVSAVTHELKTPLALIRLVGDTLASGRYASPDVIPDYAGLLSRETARLSQSIDNLLTYARYTDAAAAQAPDVGPHDLTDLVDDALERFQPTLRELAFQVTIDVPRELTRVMVDGRAIVQTIEIVLDNAIKYADASRVMIISARAEGHLVRLTIADRGVGVSGDDLPHVFEQFYRGRNAKGSGSGLGLAIARRIVRRHGGEITMRSVLGAGSEVEIELPTTRSA